jgi:hypothetical protein
MKWLTRLLGKVRNGRAPSLVSSVTVIDAAYIKNLRASELLKKRRHTEFSASHNWLIYE